MAAYDPEILQKYADKLYSQAGSAIAAWAVRGFLVGAIAGFALSATVARDHPGACVIDVGVIAIVIGVLIGRERAFHLKLEAQRALCQLQIEKNTRAKQGVTTPIVAD